MSTPHNAAAAGDFAKTVLMPGDPLRAKFIAETFLESPGLVTSVRGMLGYTGTYKGVPVSVMGSGMGMPSIGIYSWELFTQYGVENIIRIGSAGSYSPQAKVFDVVLATSAYSESSYAKTQNGYDKDVTYPSEVLCGALRKSAARLGMHFSNNPAVNRRVCEMTVRDLPFKNLVLNTSGIIRYPAAEALLALANGRLFSRGGTVRAERGRSRKG